MAWSERQRAMLQEMGIRVFADPHPLQSLQADAGATPAPPPGAPPGRPHAAAHHRASPSDTNTLPDRPDDRAPDHRNIYENVTFWLATVHVLPLTCRSTMTGCRRRG